MSPRKYSRASVIRVSLPLLGRWIGVIDFFFQSTITGSYLCFERVKLFARRNVRNSRILGQRLIQSSLFRSFNWSGANWFGSFHGNAIFRENTQSTSIWFRCSFAFDRMRSFARHLPRPMNDKRPFYRSHQVLCFVLIKYRETFTSHPRLCRHKNIQRFSICSQLPLVRRPINQIWRAQKTRMTNEKKNRDVPKAKASIIANRKNDRTIFDK